MARSAVVVAAVILLAVGACAPPAAAQSGGGSDQAGPASGRVVYAPPVDGVITDHFRAPPTPYAAGNRGLDYATVPGTPVRAAADGEVVFAGAVAGALHVTVRHADGLRTSYSFLDTIEVAAGARIRRGDVLGRTGAFFHVGVRDPAGRYLDPEALFAGASPVRHAYLVPGTDDGAPPLAERRSLFGVVVERLGAFEARVGATGYRRLALLAHYARVTNPVERLAEVHDRLDRWWRNRDDCTPASAPPPPPEGRRIAVLVGGLGSTSAGAAVADVDTSALGYAAGDVVRFSYGGGRVPDALPAGSALAGLSVSSYSAADSQADLRASAARLATLLAAVARAAPGVPIDVIAHSQGGLVSRLALEDGGPDGVATLVTLGTPHGGADLATAVEALRSNPGADASLAEIRSVLGVDIDPSSPAVGQLAETSDVVSEVRDHPVPDRVRVVSIAARGDLVVPQGRTVVDGRPSVVVPISGLHAHDRLPSSPQATREIALAVAGRAPTCERLGDVAGDLLVGESISVGESVLGAAALDGGLGPPGWSSGASTGSGLAAASGGP